MISCFEEKFAFWEALSFFAEVDWNYSDCEGRNLAFWAVCCSATTEDCIKYLDICSLKNTDIGFIDKLGNNSAMMAVRHRKLGILKYLIEDKKCDINFCNRNGISLAHRAAQYGFGEILEYLIIGGADAICKNKYGLSVVDVVMLYNSTSCIEVLKKLPISICLS